MHSLARRLLVSITFVCTSIFAVASFTAERSTRIEQIDSQLASLARDQIRAGQHKRFLSQQQESILISPPNTFIFDYPPSGLESRIKQIFWNEPEGLFAMIDAGAHHNLLPGHLLTFFKMDQYNSWQPGGALVVIQVYDTRSYAMILRANLVPAVNDMVK